ncbi:hypothetical protein B0H34DRAFT_38344 [Crassisporium funariophilum]|nr:hypothetical protein B0H34DRAFT_38344 [Crassisporium funariophilum]
MKACMRRRETGREMAGETKTVVGGKREGGDGKTAKKGTGGWSENGGLLPQTYVLYLLILHRTLFSFLHTVNQSTRHSLHPSSAQSSTSSRIQQPWGLILSIHARSEISHSQSFAIYRSRGAEPVSSTVLASENFHVTCIVVARQCANDRSRLQLALQVAQIIPAGRSEYN